MLCWWIGLLISVFSSAAGLLPSTPSPSPASLFAGIIARLARSESFTLGCDRFFPEMSAVLSWLPVVCFVFTTW